MDPRLLRRAAAVRRLLVGQTVIGTLSALSVVAIAYCIGSGVGTAFTTHTVQPLLSVTPWLAGAFLARGLLSWLADLVAVRAAIAVKSQLRREITQAYLRPGDPQPDHGTVTSLISTGLDDLDGYFARYLPQLVLAVAAPLVIGIAVAVQDLISAVIIALTLPLIPIFMILVGWSTQKLTGRRWRVQARLAHHFADLVAGLPTLRAFGRARAQAEGLRRSGEAHRVETMATLRIALLSALVLELAATLSVAVVAVVIGIRVIAGDVSLSTSLFVLILAPEAYLPLRKVGVHYHDAAAGAAAARTALDLIDRVPVARVGTAAVPTGPVELAASGLTFRYPAADRETVRPVLSGVDAVVRAGDLTCLVGPSGSGKTTLLMLMMGWLRPDSGRVRINDVDLDDLDLEELRRRIAWVGQQPGMIPGTIAANVQLGAPDADAEQVAAALRSADVDLDPGRQLDAAEVGRLSGGELRRVALARALLRVRHGGAGLMILDEPTAGLDAATELRTIELIRSLGVTALVVSHRPAVIAAADHLIELGTAVTPERVAA
ncbi:thiol reductant ABC exporter subunit CydD [Microlunatus soli]|uniref:thiol reductant ABC exporter subunit CydD n=1 Tax=Microlunatus soli TaxID=630515 RepID=UPI0038B4176A